MTKSAATTNGDIWTVQRILQWTTEYFQKHQIESARLEAELLLAHARGCQRIRLYTDFEVELTESERAQMRDFVKRRVGHEPIAYITGKREFYGRDFQVGPGVLVPRPDTETLIDVCLELLPKSTPAKIAEIGFGSGCISVTLAKQRDQLVAFAGDISENAFAFAKNNVKVHDVAARVHLVLGDLYSPLASEGPFDGIVSNAPYIKIDELSDLDAEVRLHEPHSALVSGEDGLDAIRRIVAEAPSHLKSRGWLALELDPSQSGTVAELLIDAGFSDVRTVQDLSGQDRVVTGSWMND